MESTYARPYGDGTLLNVWIQPRASKTSVAGIHGDSVKIAVKAPPVEGKANEACVEFLSSLLGLPKRQFEIKSGQQSRRKGLYIKGMTPEQVVTSLQSALSGS